MASIEDASGSPLPMSLTTVDQVEGLASLRETHQDPAEAAAVDICETSMIRQ